MRCQFSPSLRHPWVLPSAPVSSLAGAGSRGVASTQTRWRISRRSTSDLKTMTLPAARDPGHHTSSVGDVARGTAPANNEGCLGALGLEGWG